MREPFKYTREQAARADIPACERGVRGHLARAEERAREARFADECGDAAGAAHFRQLEEEARHSAACWQALADLAREVQGVRD